MHQQKWTRLLNQSCHILPQIAQAPSPFPQQAADKNCAQQNLRFHLWSELSIYSSLYQRHTEASRSEEFLNYASFASIRRPFSSCLSTALPSSLAVSPSERSDASMRSERPKRSATSP